MDIERNGEIENKMHISRLRDSIKKKNSLAKCKEYYLTLWALQNEKNITFCYIF